jgi:pimeloyl-ACP methyl ester carboxylesterase
MSEIYFSQRGSGSQVILLHGFPLHSGIWSDFAETLGKNFNVFTPDLPGFGKSASLPSPFSIDDVGDSIISWMESQSLKNTVLIGHSLGGYVALSVAEKRPDLLTSIGLFHSTANADNEEKRQSRNKVLEFIDKNGVETFTSNFIAPLFYNQKHPAIEAVRAISRQSNVHTVKGYTLAMRDRPDRKKVLKTFPKPILFIGGEHDAGISPDSLKEQATICSDAHVHILTKVGHMGMFENAEKSLEIISAFIRKPGVTS